MNEMNAGRDAGYHVIKNAIGTLPSEQILRIYENVCRARQFDIQVIKAVENKRVIAPVYLSLGQEAVAAALSEVIKDFHIFSQHRAHDLYVSLGCCLEELRDELIGLPSGFSGGRAGSSCLRYMKDGIKLYGHHGLIGENVPQAVGAALASNEETVCIFGDGSAEEDYVSVSIGFAASRQLPVLFICMDNDLSILTPKVDRRRWEISDLAKGYGMEAYDIADCPWTLLSILEKWDRKKPLLINCRVCRERWHSGIGIDSERDWKRNEIMKDQIIELGYGGEAEGIEKMAAETMEALWSI